MKNYIKVLMTTFVVLVSTQTFAQQLIPFQARLTNGSGLLVPNGVYSVNFNIYDTATSGTALWTETHSTVSVVSGVVNVILGSITPLNDPNNDGNTSDALNFYTADGNRFIGVTIGSGQEMVPRHQLIPSFHARTADFAVEANHAALSDQATQATNATNATNLGGLPASDYALLSETGDSFTTLTARLDALEEYTNAYTVPTGTILPIAGPNLPSDKVDDYYSCNGDWVLIQNVDGAVAVNEALFDVIGYRYGKDVRNAGVDIYFRLPDYRGRFLRGWANGATIEIDRNTRVGFDVDGNLVTGDYIGSRQAQQIQIHQHGISYSQPANGGNPSYYGSPGHILSGGSTTSTHIAGGNETRPLNTSVQYIIKR